MAPPDLQDLAAYAIERSLFPPTTLSRAIERLGFVQADPIRAPARAQDLTLRHRVNGYRAGDLERRYEDLDVEEDYFVNYGFVPRRHLALMHPRTPRRVWDRATKKRAASVLAFVVERGEVHPREVEAHFAHGRVTNYWGGSSNATTQLLDGMHYRGLLRVVRRERGVRVYAPVAAAYESSPSSARARADALVAIAVQKYAPLPARSLAELVSRIRLGAPQLATELRASLQRARLELPRLRMDGVDWFYPPEEEPRGEGREDERVRLLAPFDPVVWDRRRFELFWGWAYRFEAYTPVAKRVRGYYALPLLWRNDVIGWANLTAAGAALEVDLGYVAGRPPRERAFAGALDEEIERMRAFLEPASRRARRRAERED